MPRRFCGTEVAVLSAVNSQVRLRVSAYAHSAVREAGVTCSAGRHDIAPAGVQNRDGAISGRPRDGR